MTALDYARRYVAAGLSVFPVRLGGDKAPAVPHWVPYRDRVPTDDELVSWFGPYGIAVVGGVVCGREDGLAVFDHESRDAYERWLVHIGGAATELADCPVACTPGGGVHVYIRCRVPPRSMKLAYDEAGETLIEIKGAGGYVLAPGGNPAAHESNKPYTWERLGWLAPYFA